MAKIIAPNKGYTGMTASVPFAGGVGYTDDEHLIAWFQTHKYTVDTSAEKPVDMMTVAELRAYAEGKGIDLGTATKKEDILAAIKAGKQG